MIHVFSYPYIHTYVYVYIYTHCIALHYITLHYITYIILHYIILHYINTELLYIMHIQKKSRGIKYNYKFYATGEF